MHQRVAQSSRHNKRFYAQPRGPACVLEDRAKIIARRGLSAWSREGGYQSHRDIDVSTRASVFRGLWTQAHLSTCVAATPAAPSASRRRRRLQARGTRPDTRTRNGWEVKEQHMRAREERRWQRALEKTHARRWADLFSAIAPLHVALLPELIELLFQLFLLPAKCHTHRQRATRLLHRLELHSHVAMPLAARALSDLDRHDTRTAHRPRALHTHAHFTDTRTSHRHAYRAQTRAQRTDTRASQTRAQSTDTRSAP